MSLNLVTVTYVRCPFCGYSRALSANEAANWRIGAHASGSQECPACRIGRQSNLSVAQSANWRASDFPGVMR